MPTGEQTGPAEPEARPVRRLPRTLLVALVVLAVAGALGLVADMQVVRRGRTLASDSSTAEVVVRPTFVISMAASPVVPGASPTPASLAQPSTVPGTAPVANTTTYTVEPGDTLRSIAHKVYGDANQWPRLYDANRELIGANPDNLQAGMQLTVP